MACQSPVSMQNVTRSVSVSVRPGPRKVSPISRSANARAVASIPSSHGSFAPLPEPRAQLEFFGLAVGKFRQRLDETHLARALVSGDAIAAMSDQRVRAGVAARAPDHEGDD